MFVTLWWKCTTKSYIKCQCVWFRAGCPVGPGFTLSKVYTVRPTLLTNKDKRGLALDGQLKHEDTNLASSTMWVHGVTSAWFLGQGVHFGVTTISGYLEQTSYSVHFVKLWIAKLFRFLAFLPTDLILKRNPWRILYLTWITVLNNGPIQGKYLFEFLMKIIQPFDYIHQQIPRILYIRTM